jgi:hypothetical protein
MYTRLLGCAVTTFAPGYITNPRRGIYQSGEFEAPDRYRRKLAAGLQVQSRTVINNLQELL